MENSKSTKKTFSIILLCAVLMGSCTKTQRARNYGGNEDITLKANERLINITWKGNNMWMLTEDTLTRLKYFRENSAWGVWEGEIIIK